MGFLFFCCHTLTVLDFVDKILLLVEDIGFTLYIFIGKMVKEHKEL